MKHTMIEKTFRECLIFFCDKNSSSILPSKYVKVAANQENIRKTTDVMYNGEKHVNPEEAKANINVPYAKCEPIHFSH